MVYGYYGGRSYYGLGSYRRKSKKGYVRPTTKYGRKACKKAIAKKQHYTLVRNYTWATHAMRPGRGYHTLVLFNSVGTHYPTLFKANDVNSYLKAVARVQNKANYKGMTGTFYAFNSKFEDLTDQYTALVNARQGTQGKSEDIEPPAKKSRLGGDNLEMMSQATI